MANEENPSDPLTFNAGFKGLVPFSLLNWPARFGLCV